MSQDFYAWAGTNQTLTLSDHHLDHGIWKDSTPIPQMQPGSNNVLHAQSNSPVHGVQGYAVYTAGDGTKWKLSFDVPYTSAGGNNSASISLDDGSSDNWSTSMQVDDNDQHSRMVVTYFINKEDPPSSADAVSDFEVGSKNGGQFQAQSAFTLGDKVDFQVVVIDAATNKPLAGAVVTVDISGPSAVTRSSDATDSDGQAYARWNTSPSTPSGNYTATVTGVAADGYTWDGNSPGAQSFTLS